MELGHTVQVQHRTLGKVKVVWRDLNAHKMTTLLEKVSGGGKRPNTISNTSWQPFRPVLTSSFLLLAFFRWITSEHLPRSCIRWTSVLDFVKKKKSETENPRDEYDDSRSWIVASKLNAKMNAH